MNTILIVAGTISALIVVLKVWNTYSLSYNHEILRNSKCKNCSVVLGAETIEDSVKELEIEKEKFKSEAKMGAVKLHNMKLICSNCGTVNFERDLYKAKRVSRKNKNDTPTKLKRH